MEENLSLSYQVLLTKKSFNSLLYLLYNYTENNLISVVLLVSKNVIKFPV